MSGFLGGQLGLEAWTAYVPAVTSETGALTTTTINRARYLQIGKTVFVTVDLTLTNVGNGGGSLFVPLPVAAAGATSLSCFENNNTGAIRTGRVRPADLTTISIQDAAGNSAISVNSRFVLNGSYEAA